MPKPSDGETLKSMLLSAPDTQLDKPLKDKIKDWDEQPTALQIKEVCDLGARYGLATDFAMHILYILLEDAILKEGTTHEAISKIADETWRAEILKSEGRSS